MADSEQTDYGEYGPLPGYSTYNSQNSGEFIDSTERVNHRRSRDRSGRSRSRSRDRRRRRHRSSSRSRSRSRSRERRRRDHHRSERDRQGKHRSRSRHDADRDDHINPRSFESDERPSSSSRRDTGEEREYFSQTLSHSQSQGTNNSKRTSGVDWRSKLTSIRDAHFNRNKQAPVAVQNTFKNDGSFLEMFKKKLAGQGEDGSSSVTPNSLVLASSSIPFSDGLSLPPLTATPIQDTQSISAQVDDQDVDGIPMAIQKPLPMPKSVGKRRLTKPLKTGVVFKKPQEPAEDEASQEKLDAWSRYLQEVQRYKTANCTDEDVSRPLVK